MKIDWNDMVMSLTGTTEFSIPAATLINFGLLIGFGWVMGSVVATLTVDVLKDIIKLLLDFIFPSRCKK